MLWYLVGGSGGGRTLGLLPTQHVTPASFPLLTFIQVQESTFCSALMNTDLTYLNLLNTHSPQRHDSSVSYDGMLAVSNCVKCQLGYGLSSLLGKGCTSRLVTNHVASSKACW